MKTLKQFAKEITKDFECNFREEMTLEVFLEMLYDNNPLFENEVNRLGGLRALEDECWKINKNL